MKLTNYAISDVNHVIGELADVPIKGAFKFKIFNNKQNLEDKIVVLQKAIEGVTDQGEFNEIMSVEQDIYLEKFTFDELEELPLTLRQLTALKPIMEIQEPKTNTQEEK